MSFSEWKEVKFQELYAEPSRNGLTKPKKVRGQGIKFVNMGELFSYDRIGEQSMNLAPVTIKERENFLLKEGDLLFARQSLVREGAGKCSIILKHKEEMTYDSHLIRVRLNKNVADPKFYYYFFKAPQGKDAISTIVEQVAAAGIRGTDLARIKVPLPSYSEQEVIAATLSALDDMIELNNQTNKTLEEMAQAIFKSWFVDFEPFKDGEFEESELGLIPKGWRVGCIGDYVKVKSGFAFKSSWWETSGVPVIKIKEIDNYTINFGDVSYVSEDKAALAKDFRVNGGDLLIAMTGATIGKFAIVPKMPSFAVVNQRVGKFFLGDNPLEKLGFIYCILKQDNVYKEIVSRGEGSAQPNISPSGIESIKIVLPPERLINEYNQLVMKFFKMIIENTAENALLICLRDTLLPKLMSGEIRVPVEEVV
jgi:type I restriction enzyme S subunit